MYTFWHRLPRSFRGAVALALLALTLHATQAMAGDCIAVDSLDRPRDCTLSEELGACGNDAYESWAACADPDSTGHIDVGFWRLQGCNILAAVDLASCAVEVPWEAING